MNIYCFSNENAAAIQNRLQSEFQPVDTWGTVDISVSPERAEKAFLAAIDTATADKEQERLVLLAQQFPDKYKNITPVAAGKIGYSVFPTVTGSRILFVSNFAKQSLKAAFNAKTMGAGTKTHTGKIKNMFEPSGWNKASWFFVAYALETGNENEFAPVSRYS